MRIKLLGTLQLSKIWIILFLYLYFSINIIPHIKVYSYLRIISYKSYVAIRKITAKSRKLLNFLQSGSRKIDTFSGLWFPPRSNSNCCEDFAHCEKICFFACTSKSNDTRSILFYNSKNIIETYILCPPTPPPSQYSVFVKFKSVLPPYTCLALIQNIYIKKMLWSIHEL